VNYNFFSILTYFRLYVLCIFPFDTAGNLDDLEAEVLLLVPPKTKESRSKAADKRQEREEEASRIEDVVTSAAATSSEIDQNADDSFDYKAAYEKTQARLKKYKSKFKVFKRTTHHMKV